jgi:NTP-dependent ternary system trypsin peptidase co-occuring protein
MVSNVARFSLESGGAVHIDVDEEPGIKRVAREGKIPDAAATFEKGLREIHHAAGVALTQFRAMSLQPDLVEITFGVRMDAQVGAVIAKTGMAGNFEVKLTWQLDASDIANESANSA